MVDVSPILILGAGGMLARALLRAARRDPLQAIALDRAACDITRNSDIAAAIDANRPAVVINAAAYTAVDRAEVEHEQANETNGRAVGLLAARCRAAGVKLVHVSTDAVFDGASDRPYQPDDPTNPLSAYAKSKLLGERLLQDANPPGWLIARTAWLFGHPGSCFPRTIVQKARGGQPLRVVDDQFGSPSYADDVAVMLLALVRAGATGIFHTANAGVASWFDVAEASLAAFDERADLWPMTTAAYVASRPGSAPRPRFTALDLSKTADVVGPIPSWRDAMRRYRDAVAADGAFAD